MKPIEIIAQAIGIIAMVLLVISYQFKGKKSVIALQFLGSLLFSINYLMLGAFVGCLLNFLAAIRAVVYYYKDKFKADKIFWFYGFVATYVLSYVLNFTVFGKAPTALNLIVEILPVIGMTALDVGYRLKNTAGIRKCGLISAPAWFIYNLFSGSWGALVCDVFTIGSIIIGIFRNDRNTKE